MAARAGFGGGRFGLLLALSFPLAGMDGLNHWIPACAGMTAGGPGFSGMTERTAASISSGMATGLVRMATNLFRPLMSFQRRLACMDAGGRAASGTGRRGIQEGRPGGERMAGFVRWRVRLSFVLSFPLCGNELLNHWILACAGMTVSFGFGLAPGGYGHPRRPVPDAALPPTSCRRALSPHTGLPRPLVPDAALPPTSL